MYKEYTIPNNEKGRELLESIKKHSKSNGPSKSFILILYLLDSSDIMFSLIAITISSY